MIARRPLFCFILFIFSACCAIAQQEKIDSLNAALKTAKHDTSLARIYVMLTEYYAVSDLDTVIPMCEKAIAIAEKGMPGANEKELEAYREIEVTANNNIGYVYSVKGEVVKALEYYEKSKALLDILKDKGGLADYYISVGFIYNNQGDVERALNCYHLSLAYRQEIGDKPGEAATLNNLGVIYNRQNDLPKAVDYFSQALVIYEKMGEKTGTSAALNNLAAVYEKQNDTAKAMSCYRKSLAIRKEQKDIRGIGNTLTNIGVLYDRHGDPGRALQYYNEAIAARINNVDRNGTASTLVNIATLYHKQGDWKNAILYGQKALAISQDAGYPDPISRSSEVLSMAYAKTGDYKNAYDMHVLFKKMSDSIINDATKKAALKAQMQYTFDQREAKQKADQDIKDARQKLIIYSISAGLVLVLLLALFIFRGYRQKQRANEIITAQKLEVEKSKLIIEEKNTDILDSINYARRIQQAKLPKREEILEALPESFVLFRPKDIVSGDFYFFTRKNNYIFIAAADCTGHGVPGALMSMIGSERLTEAVQQSVDPGEILALVNRGIKKSLRQTESDESTRDGMDIALCRIEQNSGTILFAGANRPFCYIRKGTAEVNEIKAIKKALGGLTEDEQQFETHKIQLDAGDNFYIFSDGYADLFNGETGKKLTTKKFKEILLGIRDRTMREQENYLSDFAVNWKAGTEQIDDILVIGVQL
jgi:serine phosphatase RsbU (regulator of sigma subunit)/Flp pilus assembly protein TadD